MLLMYFSDANNRVRLDIKQTKLMGVLKTTKQIYVFTEFRGGSRGKNDKRENGGVIGTHDDNDPNSYFASYIYTMHVCACVSALCLGNDCFLTWMPCNHICILFYHGHTAISPTPLILLKAIHNNHEILGSGVQMFSSPFLS